MVSGYVWFGTSDLLPQPKAPFSWTQLRRNQESDVWPMVSGTTTVRWSLELRQSDGLWNYDRPMVFGTATVRWSLELRQSDGLWNCDSPCSMFSIVLEKTIYYQIF